MLAVYRMFPLLGTTERIEKSFVFRTVSLRSEEGNQNLVLARRRAKAMQSGRRTCIFGPLIQGVLRVWRYLILPAAPMFNLLSGHEEVLRGIL